MSNMDNVIDLKGYKDGVHKLLRDRGWETTYIKNGKKDGPCEGLVLTERGAGFYKGQYKDGKRDGFFYEILTSYKHGTNVMQGEYVEGKMEGTWENILKNGKHITHTTFKGGEEVLNED